MVQNDSNCWSENIVQLRVYLCHEGSFGTGLTLRSIQLNKKLIF
ncbi:Uncharacterized protein APZ42_001685 [Daphnia magna]|uniref:Uncharacterized protein n=1 Tax=Daphnia magna TaxID=35525 RepID=A0A164ITV1_9CRUS|nr:Uncharacterized protein APZ42_001685 [Daphnia magna]